MLQKSDLEQLLRGIDEEAALTLGPQVQPVSVVIVGGSALMLRNLTSRPATHDVDVLAADSAVSQILARYPAVNGMVSAHADEIPYNFEDRLVRILPDTRAIAYLTPSLEDLAIMKLYAWRPNDEADLTSPAVLEALNWELLDHLVFDEDEAKAAALVERRYREMVDVYRLFREEYGPCD